MILRFFAFVFVVLAALNTKLGFTADIVLPLTFDQYQLPEVQLQLGDKSYSLMLDTGSAEGLHLTRETLRQITNVHFSGEMQKSSDLAGNIQENSRFIIDTLPVQGQVFHNIRGVEFTPWGITISKDTALPESQVIGLGFFHEKKIMIDYKAKKLTIFDDNSMPDLESEAGWVHVPFQQTDEGLLLDVKVTGENHTMSLDTGATLSFVIADKIKDKSTAVACGTVNPSMQEKNCRMIPVITEFDSNKHTIHAYILEEAPENFNNSL